MNNTESDLISGKTKKTQNQSEFQSEMADGEDSERLDLDDLMEEMVEPINLAENENLKLASMHHFTLKPRDVVQVYRFSGRQSCHALYMKLLNYVSLMNDKRKSTKEGPQTEIIAPKPFANCLVKKCNMTYKGVVETRAKQSNN